MPELAENPVEPESNSEAIRCFEEVLQSTRFERAPRLRALLFYLWKNRNEDISEYAIAVDALGRKSDFDPKIDATVRVQIARLRSFLEKYYESEGNKSATRLVIPVGTHQIRVVDQPDSPLAGALESNSTADSRSDRSTAAPTLSSIALPAARKELGNRRLLVPILVTVVILLSSGLGLLAWMLTHQSGKKMAGSRQEIPLFWRGMTDNGKPIRVVLPTPMFFSWQVGNKSLMARDISVNDPAELTGSAELAGLEKRLGKPAPWRNYTTASDTFAALQLVRFLDSYEVHSSISSSTESPREIIDYENVIAFGTFSSLGAYQSELDRLSFRLAPHERYVIDKRGSNGDSKQFSMQEESASRTVMPGLIALLPRGTSGSRILLVQGAQTMALISYLTSENGMREIAQAQANSGHNPYFEAVILCEVNGGNPIQARLVAFRPFFPEATHPSQVKSLDTASPVELHPLQAAVTRH